MLGLFEAPLSTICKDTGLTKEKVLEAIEELLKAISFKYEREERKFGFYLWQAHKLVLENFLLTKKQE